MSIILHILCEGQTEEQFVVKVLKPHLSGFDVVCKTQLLITNKKKGGYGGCVSYDQVQRDISTWIGVEKNGGHDTHYFTTMLDLYRLPQNFPAYNNAMQQSDIYTRVAMLEDAFAGDIGNRFFIPYIQLHEFEALVFCGLDFLKDEYPNSAKGIDNLKIVLQRYNGNPEAINNSIKTAPSKRIETALEGKYRYNKVKSGPSIAGSVGIDKLRQQCAHFDSWLNKLEQLAAVPVEE